jgi:hypothetical protein
MGAESTAAIFRMLSNPAARPHTIAPDFSNLIVVIAQTGDEWSTTGRLVQHFMLPLLREHDIRLVEVARKGPTKKDGVAVLQDTRQPYRLHLEGVYKLSRENRVTGTMPQLGGVRKCSLHCTKQADTPLLPSYGLRRSLQLSLVVWVDLDVRAQVGQSRASRLAPSLPTISDRRGAEGPRTAGRATGLT